MTDTTANNNVQVQYVVVEYKTEWGQFASRTIHSITHGVFQEHAKALECARNRLLHSAYFDEWLTEDEIKLDTHWEFKHEFVREVLQPVKRCNKILVYEPHDRCYLHILNMSRSYCHDNSACVHVLHIRSGREKETLNIVPPHAPVQTAPSASTSAST